jgi:hypothetical protein
MKYFFLAVIVCTSSFPQLTYSATIADEYRSILAQTIAILEWRVLNLEAELKGESVLASAPSSALTGGIVPKRTLTSNGGGRRPQPPTLPPAPVFSMTGSGNTVTINTPVQLQPVTLTVTILEATDEVILPATIDALAFADEVNYVDITLLASSTPGVYTADLASVLTPPTNFSGVFTFNLPGGMIDEYVRYEVAYVGNNRVLTTELINSGTFDVTLHDDGSGPAPSTVVVERSTETPGVPMLGFGLSSESGGRVTLDEVSVAVEANPGVSASEVFTAAYLTVGGASYPASIESSTLVFRNIDLMLERSTYYSVAIVVDMAGQVGNYEADQVVFLTLDPSGLVLTQAGEATPVSPVAGAVVVGSEQALQARGLVIEPGSFTERFDLLNAEGTIGRFTLNFAITARVGDFYFTTTAIKLPSGSTSGVGFSIAGDYGTGTVQAVLSSTASESTPGVFMVRADETETVTLEVEMTTSEPSTFSVSLEEVWATSAGDGETGTESYPFVPPGDFTTPPQSIEIS